MCYKYREAVRICPLVNQSSTVQLSRINWIWIWFWIQLRDPQLLALNDPAHGSGQGTNQLPSRPQKILEGKREIILTTLNWFHLGLVVPVPVCLLHFRTWGKTQATDSTLKYLVIWLKFKIPIEPQLLVVPVIRGQNLWLEMTTSKESPEN